jgi:hypothetical protein
VDARSACRRERGQPTRPATDLEDPLPIQIDHGGDGRRLRALAITPLHLDPFWSVTEAVNLAS